MAIRSNPPCGECGGENRHHSTCSHHPFNQKVPAELIEKTVGASVGDGTFCAHCKLAVGHMSWCPQFTERVDDGHIVSSLTAKRFEKFERPKEHTPTSILDYVKEWIDGSDAEPDHVIILVGRTAKDNQSATRFFQAGSYAPHAQMGLLMMGMQMMHNTGDTYFEEQ